MIINCRESARVSPSRKLAYLLRNDWKMGEKLMGQKKNKERSGRFYSGKWKLVGSLLLGIFLFQYGFPQSSDSTLCFRLFDSQSKLPLPTASVMYYQLTGNVYRSSYSWKANGEGLVTIPKRDIDFLDKKRPVGKGYFVCFYDPSVDSLIRFNEIPWMDTIPVPMEVNPLDLGEVEIKKYVVTPLVSPAEPQNAPAIKMNPQDLVLDTVRLPGEIPFRELLNYLQENIRYTEFAVSQRVEGMVAVIFEVGPDGYSRNVKVMRKLCQDLDVRVESELSRLPKLVFEEETAKRMGVIRLLVKIRFRIEED